MSTLIGLVGFLGLLTGLILFIASIFSDIPKKVGTIIAVIGFLFINLSNFPKGALYGVFGFLAILVGVIMLIIYLVREKPVKNPIIVIVLGFISFFGALSIPTETSNATQETPIEAAETQGKVEEPEKEVAEEIIEETEDKEKISEGTTDEKEEPIEDVIGIGDAIVIDDVHYVINEVTSAKNVGGEYGKDAISQFTIINLTVQNEQNEAIKVDSDQFQLVSGERTYEASGSAGIYANKDYDFFYTEINPGVALSGNIVFDVPADLENLQLYIQNDFWGNKTGIVHLQ
ncbi:hypothetical protein BBH88_17780 [Planococcus antarcticus DSM 14505]|uniref:DUF4352 domain-containing protein n=1 Tax=Planococcus antarcticus DSM 14505 TaxID=1185653 RepID=A0ABM6D939_9BACL|nr:DUF4352 domain-containing protein [Planococcus antarcticus]ANU11971.1 hypothetical protein BBH88_17780 [Planococcus antarcticus DSM 14505]